MKKISARALTLLILEVLMQCIVELCLEMIQHHYIYCCHVA